MKKSILITLSLLLIGTFGCLKPKFVATLGSDIYHNPDCKYVQNSLDKYGTIKRLDYHFDLQKDLSGRKPCPKCIK
jgi:hypothetical protein